MGHPTLVATHFDTVTGAPHVPSQAGEDGLGLRVLSFDRRDLVDERVNPLRQRRQVGLNF